MRCLAVLGRQPEISVAEIEAIFGEYGAVRQVGEKICLFRSEKTPEIRRFGGSLKFAVQIETTPEEYSTDAPEGKITIGVSDYSRDSNARRAGAEALRIKRKLVQAGRSVRVVENKEAVLSTATSLHNGLSGVNPRKVEFLKLEKAWYRVVGVQDIEAYAKRDQVRPARDAKVGMLPPKLAQILINLCGVLKPEARILDPFCGTGVVLQEALLMGYQVYGTDVSERMVEYSKRNLEWLDLKDLGRSYRVEVGDAMTCQWAQPIDAVACEGYLGRPMLMAPTEVKLMAEMQECKAIIVGFFKNLSAQISPDTPVVVAAPAWLRLDGTYSRLKILDEIEQMGYNVSKKTREGLLYARVGQVVARDIIILRKK